MSLVQRIHPKAPEVFTSSGALGFTYLRTFTSICAHLRTFTSIYAFALFAYTFIAFAPKAPSTAEATAINTFRMVFQIGFFIVSHLLSYAFPFRIVKPSGPPPHRLRWQRHPI